MGELTDRLRKNSESDIYPFHMPGHKRNLEWNINPYAYDITETDGFDDLHNPTGILADMTRRVNMLYGAKASFILVNGSTAGILSAVSASLDTGDTVLMARNCHKSAYNAAYIRQLKTEYIYPQIDRDSGIALEIKAEDVEKAYDVNPRIKAVLLVSPTYEGVVSDIEAIAKAVHRRGGILIVDCAHGAHFGTSEAAPVNPLQSGADIVVMSLHKTLASFTQTAVMCVGTDRVDLERLKYYADIYVSTSPSYLLMASVERCLDIMEQSGNVLWQMHYRRMKDFRRKCAGLKKLYLFESSDYDIARAAVCTDRCGLSGNKLMDMLRKEYRLELEMASARYAVAITTCHDTQEGLDRLYNALEQIDRSLGETTERGIHERNFRAAVSQRFTSPDKICEPWQAERSRISEVSLKEAVNRAAADYIYIYPPGIPWIVPGEIITPEITDMIKTIGGLGIEIRGLTRQNTIRILDLEKNNG